MDWIHCNECFAQPHGGPRSGQSSSLDRSDLLYLTSCGHIFCGNCVGEDICKDCKSKCTVIQLVNDLKPEVKPFFSEPDEILSQLQEVLDFQKQHRVKLTAHRVLLESKYGKAKSEIKRLTQIAEKMYGDLVTLYKENKALKSQIQSLKKSHPLEIGSKSAFHMSSPVEISSSQASRNFKSPFQSDLVTPMRVSRQKSVVKNGSRETEFRGAFKLPASILTPSSTMSYRSADFSMN